MSYPSISILLSGTGITAILFVANWFVWRMTEVRNFRFGPRAAVSTNPSGAKDLDDGGFKSVA